MNCRLCLLAIILALLLTSCANLGKNESESTEMEEVIFDDGYKAEAENEVNIDDREFKEKEGMGSMPGVNFQEVTKIGADNSKISTMSDRYGNKTETRHFNYHPRLSFVLLQTSAEGKRQVFVYGQNGEVKGLSEDMLDKVLTAPADEIANLAGILHPQRQVSISVQNNPSPNSIPLRPMPSYNFPVQSQPSEPVASEEKIPAAEQEPAQNKETSPEKKSDSLP